MVNSATPISFTGKLSLQDALDLHHYLWRLTVRRPFRWTVNVFSLLIALLCIWSIAVAGLSSVVIPVLLLCLYFPVGWLLERRFLVARRYRRHPEHYIESTVSFTPEAVSVHNANLQMSLAWNQLRSVVDTPRGLLLLTPPHNALCWLPNRLFDGNGARESILALASSNNVPIARMA